jgi:hypothetical protein
MTLRDLAAQLIVITSYGEAPATRSAAFKDLVHSVRDLKVGGVIVSIGGERHGSSRRAVCDGHFSEPPAEAG